MGRDGRLNCWDFQGCEHGAGGNGGRPEGQCCRAFREEILDGVNGGLNGGRACWAVAGSLAVDLGACTCRGPCVRCRFRKTVFQEEAGDFLDTFTILEKLGYSPVLGLHERPEARAESDPE